jgi:hypothetical protein
VVGPLGGHWTSSYGPVSPGWGGGAFSSEPQGEGGWLIGHGSVTCAGQIVARFDWIPEAPDDLPPKSAVLGERAAAAWSGENGTASDGLGHGHVPGQYGGSSSGTRYTVVQNPGPTYYAICEPFAYGYMSSSFTQLPYASANVQYDAWLTPVEIVLSGVTRHIDANHVLIGQGISAYVSVAGFTTANHSWTLTSSHTFRSVEYGAIGQASAPPPERYRHSRTIHELSNADVTSPTLSWYFDRAGGQGDPQKEWIDCQVDLYVGSEFIGSASAEKIVWVWVPYYFYGWNQGGVTYDPSNVNAEYIRCEDPSVFPWVGMRFVGAVSVPGFFGPGRWAFAQTCDLYRNQSGPYGWRVTDLEDFYLDNSWPYSLDWDAPNDGAEAPEHETQDSPWYEIINWATYVSVSDDFRMFEIFQPPYGPGMHGVEWVSLHVLYWHWEGSGTEGSGGVWSGPNGIVIALGSEPYRHDLLQWDKAYPYDY